MMFTKCSRRFVTCVVLACLIFTVISLGVPKAAEAYSCLESVQWWDIYSFNYWEVWRYNFFTGTWYSWYGFGQDSISYNLGNYGTYKAFLVLDYGYYLRDLMYILEYFYGCA